MSHDNFSRDMAPRNFAKTSILTAFYERSFVSIEKWKLLYDFKAFK